MYGPLLVGEKVKLRPHTPADAEMFVSFLTDPEVTRYMARQEPMGVKEEQDWVEARAADPDTLSWTIEARKRAVGSVGFHVDWRHGVATAGIFIGDKALWDTGIATEVAQLGVNYMFANTCLRKLKASYLEPNVASAKVQAGVGLKEVGRWHDEYLRDGVWVDHVLTELTREEWLSSKSN